MLFRAVRYRWAIALLFVSFLITFGWTQAVHAQAPHDLACRGCHGDNQRDILLPSGESLPLLVPLEQLDESVHSFSAHEAITCTDCHQNATNYRFPHEPISATDRVDYTLAAAAACESCHYAHNPFHAGVEPVRDAPTCVDCHTAHEIEPFERMVEEMPSALHDLPHG